MVARATALADARFLRAQFGCHHHGPVRERLILSAGPREQWESFEQFAEPKDGSKGMELLRTAQRSRLSKAANQPGYVARGGGGSAPCAAGSGRGGVGSSKRPAAGGGGKAKRRAKEPPQLCAVTASPATPAPKPCVVSAQWGDSQDWRAVQLPQASPPSEGASAVYYWNASTRQASWIWPFDSAADAPDAADPPAIFEGFWSGDEDD